MNHNSLPMSLTGLKNHDGITWNHWFSFYGNGQGKGVDQGKSSLRYNISPYGTDGGIRRRHDVYHGPSPVMRKENEQS